jgi:hypothetical protein
MIHDETERRGLMVRLPRELKTWLENEALRNGRSQSSEAAQILLRARLDTEPKKAVG